MKLAPGWVLIRVNFDPIQEIGPKVGGGCSFKGGRSFEGGRSFTRLQYVAIHCRETRDLLHMHNNGI